jgi:hypothetical protein
MNRRAILAGLCTPLLLAGATRAAGADDGRLDFSLAAAPLELRIGPDGATRVTAPGTGTSARPGEPALPEQVLRLALPPDADPTSVTVAVTPFGVERLPGAHDVAPAPPIGLIGRGSVDFGEASARVVDGRDPLVYDADAPFPSNWGDAHPSLGGLRRYRFATVRLHPARYLPASGTLEQAAGFQLTVRYRRAPRRPVPLDGDCGGEALAARLLHNHQQARLWYREPCLGPPVTPTGLAIVTTNSIGNASTRLADYRAMREDQGWNVIVATEDQWDTPTGELLDERADRIRAWLQDSYVEEDLGFVLLLGNPDPGGQMPHNIPMKPCAMNSYSTVAATDSYYADLSGHWDQSGNGVVCEFGFDDLDLSGEGAIDFVPEVYVGRIPCYSDGAAAIDEILARAMAYEQDSVDGDIHWRRRMMLPDSIYFFENQGGDINYRRWDGATVGEWFIRDQLGPRGMEWTTLYERAGVSPSNFESHLPLETYHVVDQWNRGYGLVFWTGHGSNTGVYRLFWDEDGNQNEVPDWQELGTPSFMESDYLHMLQDAPPPFVIHGSCSNGYPETSTNLGYSLLRRGAVGTISASREAMTWHWPGENPEIWEKPANWDGDVIDIVTEYSVNLLDGMEAGRALGEAIALTTDGHGSNSWYQKAIQNLYGDPLVRLVMCRQDAECDNGAFCDGDELCDAGACVPSAAPACAPSADCDDVACDEEADLCVQGPTCENDPDAGADAGQPESLVTGGVAGCRLAPAPGGRGLLAVVLGLARPGR